MFVPGLFLELIMYGLPRLWNIRRYMAGCIVIVTGFAAGVLLAWRPNVFTVLIAAVCAYRVINLLRIGEGRMHQQYLKRTTRRTSLVLAICLVAIFVIWNLWSGIGLRSDIVLILLAGMQFVTALAMLLITIRTVIKTRPARPSKNYADRDLPSVTVAIPARNETGDLAQCLQTVIASDYQKLEILVLDDSSQDDTPAIIREFAQDGIRFIPGDPPRENWLAKNQAYKKLTQEATGQFILFCGVDVRFDSRTIRELVTRALSKNKRMISLLPKRFDSGLGIAVIQPMRYWWEIALPRRFFDRPSALSTCWLIEKSAIKQAGGFESVSRTILPESYFARELIKEDAYSFMRTDTDLQLQTVKKFTEQLDTAVRTRYPQLRKRPENVLLLTITELIFLLGPFIAALSALWTSFGIQHILAILACASLIAVHSLIITVTNPANWWLSLVNLPLVTMADIAISHVSMWKYEFSEVIWKGRDVSFPVMHVVPHLPPIDSPFKKR